MTTIAVYGASGFTGRLVLAELGRRHIDAVLVGRNAERLREAAAEIGSPTYEVRPATLDDRAALADAFRGCDVVINCVAPFALRGEPVVAAAITAGTSYIDISGEQLYINRIFDTFAAPAERAGVTVVPMVNDGGFLADLLAALTATRVEQVDEVIIAHRFVGSVTLSRGSGLTMLANREVFENRGLVYTDGGWSIGAPTTRTSFVFPGDSKPSPVVRFAMPEVATIPRHIPARHVEGVADAELLELFASLTPELVESLPARHPVDGHDAGGFMLVVDVRDRGRRARGTIDGSDTYGTTAIAAVEAARRLSTYGAKPGVLAPAQAFDAADFADSLAPHGVRWTVQEL